MMHNDQKHLAGSLFFLTAVAVLLASCSGGNNVDTGFSGDRAMQHVINVVEIGERPAGSEGAEKNRVLMEKELAATGWATQRQRFGASTPIGRIDMVNLRARFSPTGSGRDLWNQQRKIIIGCHYDTKLYTQFKFVGANDGGSGCGLLMELAGVLASRYPAIASQVELVFFDGEEAIEEDINYRSDLPLDQQSSQDGLYGSHYYARQLRVVPRQQWPEAVMIVDMIGDKNLNIRIPVNCDPQLTDQVIAAAKEVGHDDVIGRGSLSVLDDHVPFRVIGLPVVNLIDFDFEPWHTAGDTIETVSAESLQATGDIVVQFLANFLLRESE